MLQRSVLKQSERLNLHRRFATSTSASAAPRHLDLPSIDLKWQQRWTSQGSSKPLGSAPKKSYILPMFAYPSGSLHMGHLRVYTISDVISRYRRMRGDEVLHPTGWDAFGLPAENAAIERGIDPTVWTEENIAKMKTQLKSMNTSFDWDAEISTCSPSFYKHTQKIFLKLFHRGLAYQDEALVNYDPVDKTVLANEQVDSNGRSWRSGALVQQIKLRQWFFRISDFRQALLDDLDFLSEGQKWPDRVISQQRNWIGRSEGARVQFTLKGPAGESLPAHVFTTRPDTLFGVQYIALSITHPIVQQLSNNSPELQNFLDKSASFTPDSKEGFQLPLQAVNPLSHLYESVREPLPVFVAPYVLEDYGEGAVMGVPGHDSRDLSFWKLQRPFGHVKLVVQATDTNTAPEIACLDLTEPFTNHGVLTSSCGPYSGLPSREAGTKIVQDLQQAGMGQPVETWRLRDWLVSRQRYWGTPIPIVHCPDCGAVPVPERDLPVVLPRLGSSIIGQTGNPLDKIEEWNQCKCPRCGGHSTRETDTMDTFVDSSWYFLRFPDPANLSEPFSRKSAAEMIPVDTYVGGVEHAILHLLYARFIYKFLCQEGLIPDETKAKEPFQRLVAQGMVHGKTFSDPKTGKFLLPGELIEAGDSTLVKQSGLTPNVTWEKMSKSKHNGVDPSVAIEKYGADTLRAHILFAAPVSEVLQWDEEKIVGIQRWFGRVHRIVSDLAASRQKNGSVGLTQGTLEANALTEDDIGVLLLAQSTSKNISQIFDRDIYSLNTAVSDLIKLTNRLYEVGTARLTTSVAAVAITALLKLLAPIAPAFAEECWETINDGDLAPGGIFAAPWLGQVLTPDQESSLRARQNSMTCAVQINGKLRFTTQVSTSPSQRDSEADKALREAVLLRTILQTPEGRLWLTEKHDWEKRKRVVIVGTGRVVNIVF